MFRKIKFESKKNCFQLENFKNFPNNALKIPKQIKRNI